MVSTSYLNDDVRDSDEDPETPKAHCQKMVNSEEDVTQFHIDEAANPEETLQPYSDERFKRAAVQWPLETNQVHSFVSKE